MALRRSLSQWLAVQHYDVAVCLFLAVAIALQGLDVVSTMVSADFTACPLSDPVCSGPSVYPVGNSCCAGAMCSMNFNGATLTCSASCTPCTTGSSSGTGGGGTSQTLQPDPRANASLHWTFRINDSGSVNGLQGAGLVANAGRVAAQTEIDCSAAALPSSWSSTQQCDTSRATNYCSRGSRSLLAQQYSQWWCQSHSGRTCSSDQRPMLVLGKMISADFNIIGETVNPTNIGTNKFVTPSARCYAPSIPVSSSESVPSFTQFGPLGGDLCVRFKCDGSAGFLGIGVQNCNNIAYSFLFTCYDPCVQCNTQGTSSCASGSVSGNNTSPNDGFAYNCTCISGWSGSQCNIPPVTVPGPGPVAIDGGWSSWSSCSATCGSGTQTRSCTNPLPMNGGATCNGISQQSCSTQSCVPLDYVAYRWVIGIWSACSTTCGGGTQTRSAQCVSDSGAVVSDMSCSVADVKPATTQMCNTHACPLNPAPLSQWLGDYSSAGCDESVCCCFRTVTVSTTGSGAYQVSGPVAGQCSGLSSMQVLLGEASSVSTSDSVTYTVNGQLHMAVRNSDGSITDTNQTNRRCSARLSVTVATSNSESSSSNSRLPFIIGMSAGGAVVLLAVVAAGYYFSCRSNPPSGTHGQQGAKVTPYSPETHVGPVGPDGPASLESTYFSRGQDCHADVDPVHVVRVHPN